jgi:hypothetical protein
VAKPARRKGACKIGKNEADARSVHSVTAHGVPHPPRVVNQTGHEVWQWPLVVLKETVDNALDACEGAEIAPAVWIDVKNNSIIIQDNGPSIPAKTIDGVLDYSIRVSSREAYVAPTRGAQGNALKAISAMAYALDERGENAIGRTIIEGHGVAHHIAFTVDHVKQEPKITHTTKPSSVVQGAKITVTLPIFAGRDIVQDCKDRFLQLAERRTSPRDC